MLSGQVDADFLDTAIVLAEAKQTGDKLEVVGQYKTGEKYGAIYPKGSANEDALEPGHPTMLSDGTLDNLSKTYLGPAFGGDPSSVPDLDHQVDPRTDERLEPRHRGAAAETVTRARPARSTAWRRWRWCSRPS